MRYYDLEVKPVSEAFNSSSAKIGTLLSTQSVDRERIVVPTFQRGYMWKKKHVEAFWLDVDKQRELSRVKGSDPHFFGPIVTQREANAGVIWLLDGQQRLATTTILFSVLRDVAREIHAKTGAQAGGDFAANLESQFIRNEDGKYSFEMGDTDNEYFVDAIQSDPPVKKKPKYLTHRNIKDAQELLYKKVVMVIGGQIVPEMDLINAIKVLKEIKQTLVSDLVVAQIPVNSRESAFKIFATLNDRGLRLSPPDLLLSYLMEKAQESERKQIRSVWTQMIQKMGTHDIHSFLRDMWVSKYGDLKHEDLFSALKKHIEKNEISSLEFAKLCAEECDDYMALVSADEKELPADVVPYVRSLMRDLGFKTALPLLLSAYSVLQISDLVDVAKYLLVFVTRYSIFADKDSGGLEDLIYDLARTVRTLVKSEDDKVGSKQAATAVKTTLSNHSPDDAVVKAAVVRETTILEPSDAKYLLKKIANFIQDPENQTGIADTNIEHIYPQNPAESGWGGRSNQEKLEPLTWHIGNLTVFGKRANRKVENFEYAVKKPKYAASSVKMTSQIADKYDNWNEQSILKRAEYLAEKVVQIWSFENPSRV